MYRKILVPLDRSPGAEAVLPVVADLARSSGATVRLVHVAPEPRAVAVEGVVLAYADQEADRLRSEAADYLQQVAGRLGGVPVEITTRFGDPADEILDEAIEAGADLIALATHGRRGLARVVMGSVADLVVRAAPCEVLVVRRLERPAGATAGQPAAGVAGGTPQEGGAGPAASGPAAAERRCLICGRQAGERICEPCKARIRGEALERKREQEKAGRRGSAV